MEKKPRMTEIQDLSDKVHKKILMVGRLLKNSETSKVFWKEYEKVGELSEEVHEKIIRQIFPEAIDEEVNFIVSKHSLCKLILALSQLLEGPETSKVFWKEYEKVQKLSEEVHEKIIRQIFPGATDEEVNFIVSNHSLYNPCSYWNWCEINSLTPGDECSYDPYSRRAREVINDPNPLGVAISSYFHDDDGSWFYRRTIENHERVMELWDEKVESERREFERTLEAWVGLFVKDRSVSNHYYQVICNVLSPYSIR